MSGQPYNIISILDSDYDKPFISEEYYLIQVSTKQEKALQRHPCHPWAHRQSVDERRCGRLL